ncbi:MAG: rhomboid family intramembrane serine protease [Bryobacteraceae bacterium]
MAYSYRARSSGFSYSGSIPPGVKWLLISNVAIFVVYYLAPRGLAGLFYPLQLIPSVVVNYFAVWQLVTYLFLHGGFSHILFNMLSLWMFGSDLERTWGTKRFLQFYFFCGIGAGLCVVAGNYLYGTPDTPTIGASGAIYGLMMAFAMLFPETTIIFILFPIRAKYFVLILGAMSFLSSLNAGGGTVSHVAHLGGLLFGYLFVRNMGGRKVGRMDLFGPIQRQYERWRIERAKRKFQVYLRKRDSDDRWVN